jgi:hypothetical protein
MFPTIKNKRPRLLALALATAIAGYFAYWFVWPYIRMAHKLVGLGQTTS